MSQSDVQCPVCLDGWTTTGDHRFVSLKCGHCFGRSCIERWLKGMAKKDQRCPQCNTKAKLADVRPIFAKSLKAIDVDEINSVREELDRYKEMHRSKEREAAILEARLREAEEKNQELNKLLLDNQARQHQLSAARNFLPNNSPIPTRPKSIFKQTKSVLINQNGSCRTIASSKILQLLFISHPSLNSLFPGFGVRLYNTATSQMNEFMPLTHSAIIKDIAFKPDDTLLLSASLDKTLKISNMFSKTIVSSISLACEAWSCAWNTQRTNSCYAGLRNGIICEYDIRQSSEPVRSFEPFDNSPLHSIHYVNNSVVNGLFCTSLKSNYFHEFFSDDQVYLSHALPFEGKFLPAHFDPVSGYGLVSTRPSHTVGQPAKLTHSLIEFVKPADKVTAQIVRKYVGGRQSIMLSKSKVYADPTSVEQRALIFGADESARGVIVWDSLSNHPQQILELGQQDKVIDMELVEANDEQLTIAMLTEKNLFIYTKQC